MFEGMSRRDFLRITAAAAGGVGALTAMAGPVIDRAYAVDPCGTGSLDDIEHFVLLMMENRSFDHYYGTMSGVRGFRDAAATGTLEQRSDPKNPHSPFQRPFRLDTTQGASLDGECINDPTHNWGPQHQCWNGGRMDQWLKVHIANEGAANGPATMGYYEKDDIPVHRALAEAFTICDNYHCSVLGPTDPNRLYWISGMLDPEGKHGGPLLDTPTTVPINKYSWRTFPENLEEAGVSWKFYTAEEPPGISAAVLSGMTQAFKQYNTNPTLIAKGITPVYPTNFQLDVATDNLPSVSWIIPPLLNCEHPALPPSFGASTLIEVLNTLTSNPAIWEKTALIISYDENGGFFDHVAPPTPPKGTPGEFITADPLPEHRRGRHRPDRARVPGAGPGDLAVLPRRPRRVRGLRPHVAAAADRQALRRRRPQPHRLAQADGRRHDLDLRLRDPGERGQAQARGHPRARHHSTRCSSARSGSTGSRAPSRASTTRSRTPR